MHVWVSRCALIEQQRTVMALMLRSSFCLAILGVAEYDPPPLGVVYGMAGSDLPDHPKSVVELCHKYGFKKIIKAFVRDV
jgi:hypothetical protein